MNFRRRPRTDDTMIVRRVKAQRSVFVSPDIQEVEVTLLLEGGDKVTMRMRPDIAASLITQMTIAYHAINPPLRSGQAWSTWEGMH